MVVAIMATKEAEVDEVNLPVEETSHRAGTTSEGMIQFGRIAKILTLPVAARLLTVLRSIVAVRDLREALFATRKRMGEPTMMLNTELFVFHD